VAEWLSFITTLSSSLHCSQLFLIMDDSFQFIIESPQHSQGHKKRPRLVTSCDNWYASYIYRTFAYSPQSSRLKKIKCLQPSPETKCEACKSAKIPCRFRDRERYFAERSRAIAGPNSGLYATELRCALFKPLLTIFFYNSIHLCLGLNLAQCLMDYP